MGDDRRIKFGKIKGNVIISNDQQGGITANDTNGTLPKTKSNYVKTISVWVAILVGLTAILTYLNIKPDPLKTSPISPDTLKKISIPQKDAIKIYKIQHNKPMFKKKDQEENKSTKPISIGNVSGDVVISNNQSGGITAHTVIVPEDKEIPLNENFSVNETESNGLITIKISPRHGTWVNPFIGFPESERISQDIRTSSGSMATMGVANSLNEIDLAGKKTLFNLTKWQSPQVTSNTPMILYCKKRPSAIIYGDASDNQKQYIVNYQH